MTKIALAAVLAAGALAIGACTTTEQRIGGAAAGGVAGAAVAGPVGAAVGGAAGAAYGPQAVTTTRRATRAR